MEDKEPSGKARGGHARAEKLSPEKRSEIASAASHARWEQREVPSDMPVVLPGFQADLDLGGIKLPCAVIKGSAGIQRVLTENGITQALLGSRSGASKRLKKAASKDGALVPLFLAPPRLKPFINKELVDGPFRPIDYMDGERVIRGYDAAILADVCNVWLKAREAGVLQQQQLAKAQKAEILLRALAKTGIVALIDEVTGYEKVRPQNALQAYLEMLVRKDLATWAKRFPDEFYENIYKLRGWRWLGMSKNRYQVVAHYTRDLVYERLAPGLLRELEQKSPKDENGEREHKFHQWLTDDIGHPLLSQHLHSLIMFQRLAIANGFGWLRFVKMVDQVLPRRGSTPYFPAPGFADPDFEESA